jgi:hypothetical protein
MGATLKNMEGMEGIDKKVVSSQSRGVIRQLYLKRETTHGIVPYRTEFA